MARLAARLTAVVVLPTPPFWLAMVTIRQTAGGGRAAAPPRATRAAWAARDRGIGRAVRAGRIPTPPAC